MKRRPSEALFLIFAAATCTIRGGAQPVRTGLDELRGQDFAPLRGLRIGVVTNRTGVDASGEHIIDLLHRAPDVTLAAIFAPEHGLRSTAEGGETITDGRDPRTGCPIFSLYGRTKKPTPLMLRDLDAVVFDIQDVGARFYTYLSTLALVMEAAAEERIPLYLLDRPNPISGMAVEGPVLSPAWRSFVGWLPVPIRHGMTFGEIARMINGEGWLGGDLRVELEVIPMRHWTRDMFWARTGLAWIQPSPNMTSPHAALLYPGMALLEATNISEGRGTASPFELFGAPWVVAARMKQRLEALEWRGVSFDTVTFIPRSIAGVAANPKYRDRRCAGCRLTVVDSGSFRSVEFGIHLLSVLMELYPEHLTIDSTWLNKLSGDGRIFTGLSNGDRPETIIAGWEQGLSEFLARRDLYLLYP